MLRTSSLRTCLLGAVLALGSLCFSTPAQAASSDACLNGGFTVTLPSGKVLSGANSWKISPSALPSHSLLRVRGRYIEFDVDASTLAIYGYTLTGAANPDDMTGGVRTVLFTRKEPNLNGQTLEKDDLEVSLTGSDMVLSRRGRTYRMKIQAKDCAQGGIFQMEPEIDTGGSVVITHTLASPDTFYFVNPYTGKINFGNAALVRGKDSPQVATKLAQSEFETVWSVASGGRMGGVLGEDAVELSAGASPCVQDCQAQNRIRGSVPVTDPVYGDTGGETESD